MNPHRLHQNQISVCFPILEFLHKFYVGTLVFLGPFGSQMLQQLDKYRLGFETPCRTSPYVFFGQVTLRPIILTQNYPPKNGENGNRSHNNDVLGSDSNILYLSQAKISKK